MTIQTLENMLRACALDLKGMLEEHLPLVEFAYNNSYQPSIDMSRYEALYERRRRTPICLEQVRDRRLLSPEIVHIITEMIQLIRKKIWVAQSRKKSYADNKRKLEFKVGDHVFLRVSSSKGVIRFGKKGKLSPRYIRPFEILDRVGAVAYRLYPSVV